MLAKYALVALAVLIASWPREAEAETESEKDDAARLVHILSYVAADYPAAVDRGVVVSDEEYDEQLALLEECKRIARRLHGHGGEPWLERAQAVRARIVAKAPSAEVATMAQSLAMAAEISFALSMAPESAPDFARGHALFLRYCAECHAENGSANTPKARSLRPAPASFVDPYVGESLSPARVSSTARFGIAGTAMVPFQFLSTAELWDLGFFVSGLRHVARKGDRTPAYLLPELARMTDGELLDDLVAAGLEIRELGAAIAELRTLAPGRAIGVVTADIARARLLLDAARRELLAGHRGRARERVLMAHAGPLATHARALSAAGAPVHDLEERLVLVAGRWSDAPEEELARDVLVLRYLLTRLQITIAKAEDVRPRQAFALGAMTCLRGLWVVALTLLSVMVLSRSAGHRAWVPRSMAVAACVATIGAALMKQGAALQVVLGATASLFGVVALTTIAMGRQRVLGLTRADLAAPAVFLVVVAETPGFPRALADGVTLTRAPASVALGAAAAFVVLALFVREGVRQATGADERRAGSVALLLLGFIAVVLVGRGTFALQMADVLPIHGLSWVGTAWLAVRPTWEGVVSQILAAGIGCALVLRAWASNTAVHGSTS